MCRRDPFDERRAMPCSPLPEESRNDLIPKLSMRYRRRMFHRPGEARLQSPRLRRSISLSDVYSRLLRCTCRAPKAKSKLRQIVPNYKWLSIQIKAAGPPISATRFCALHAPFIPESLIGAIKLVGGVVVVTEAPKRILAAALRRQEGDKVDGVERPHAHERESA